MNDNKRIQDKEKPQMAVWQREVRCPIHGSLIGRYDVRAGLINATYYCPKCGMEYTFTIKAQKPLDFEHK
ncbi:MAG: hypothetical protein ACLSUU_06195 [Christensenellales bacterium]|nr:MAG TPA: zinc-ribbon domain protein [Caudoviricetes sp.]